jgi:hypothetical protein
MRGRPLVTTVGARVATIGVDTGTTMGLGDGLRKHGFQKWYRKELTRSHLGLLLLVLSAVGLLASVELVGRDMPISNRLGAFVLMVVCGGISLWSLRRYCYLMMRAEHVAGQAICPGCKTYGRLALERDDPQQESLQVSCRNCRHLWRISDPGDG